MFRAVPRRLVRRPHGLITTALAVAVLLSALACTPGSGDQQMGVRVAQMAETRIGMSFGPPYYGPTSFSCDGLVWWSYHQLGRTLPTGATNQYYATQHITASAARPGDLVFFHKPYDAWLFHHVGIVIGPGTMVNAENPRMGVRIDAISWAHFAGGYEAYGRVPGF